MTAPATLLEKIWRKHAVTQRDGGQSLLFIDRHFIHEGSLGAFEIIRERALPVNYPARTLGVADHYVSTAPDRLQRIDDRSRRVVSRFENEMRERGINGFGLSDGRQGIVHVVGPEQGLTLPGMTVVCGDSHTAGQGALGALAFGIGSSEVAFVFAAQALWMRRPKSLRIRVTRALPEGISAKDLALAVIRKIGSEGGTGHVIEFDGVAIRGLSLEGRLTLCNMAIEAGARSGMVAPDEITLAYLRNRPFAPQGEAFDRACEDWLALRSDPDAPYDRDIHVDADDIVPMVTWGTSPQDVIGIDEVVPVDASRQTLDYMGLSAGSPIDGLRVNRVFLGSCTNSRIEDLRAASRVIAGRSVAPHVTATVVPGSMPVKRAAEAEGLDRIFVQAGFSWREPGCSMCVGMNGEIGQPGERVASTSNRNFPGRQGPGVRTHLVSPMMAAAAAVAGCFTDVRKMTGEAR